MIVALEDALDRERFGGKGAQLAAALKAGLPVPGGFELSVEAVAKIAAGGTCQFAEGRWAVRSSAVDEDGAGASFAGQHLSLLHVDSTEVPGAVRKVHASATTPGALAYRARLGLPQVARMAVVVQRMVQARVAGVMFTKNPTTGARELVIESAWGLGEAVVMGLVTPDTFRLDRDGRLLERRIGDKDLEIARTTEGVEERPVEAARAQAATLSDDALQRLVRLAHTLDAVFEGDHDVEWAIDEDDTLFLLQRRRITR